MMGRRSWADLQQLGLSAELQKKKEKEVEYCRMMIVSPEMSRILAKWRIGRATHPVCVCGGNFVVCTSSGIYSFLQTQPWLPCTNPYLKYLHDSFYYIGMYDRSLCWEIWGSRFEIKIKKTRVVSLGVFKLWIEFLGCNYCHGRSRFLLRLQNDVGNATYLEKATNIRDPSISSPVLSSS